MIEPAVKVAESPTIEPETVRAKLLSFNVTALLLLVPVIEPDTVSAKPSLIVRPVANVVAKSPSAPIWFVVAVAPVKLAVLALPVNVPAVNMPVSEIVPLAAIDAVLVTAIVPGIVIDPAVNVAEPPEIEPGTVNAKVLSFSVTAPLPLVALTTPDIANATPSLIVRPPAAVVVNAPSAPI